MTLHLVIEYNWLHELGAHKIFFCPLCHCCYVPRAWIRIRVYVWRWVTACKYIYTYMYVLVLTYISVHMGIVIFLLHIMYYLWMIYICLMQLLFNFGNKLIFIVIVIVIEEAVPWVKKKWYCLDVCVICLCPYSYQLGLCRITAKSPFQLQSWAESSLGWGHG